MNWFKVKIISIHIPKTGGRTFRSILEDQYSEAETLYMLREEVDQALLDNSMTLSDLSNVEALHGHFMFHEIESLWRSSNARLITWLRDPIQRVVSNHRFFIKRLNDGPATQNDIHRLNLHRKDESLLTYAEMEENRNVITKFTKGAGLDDFYFIGFLEEYGEGIRSLSKKLGWNVKKVPRVNDNSDFKKKMGPISSKEEQLLREWNSEDIEFYQEAREKWKHA